MHDKPRIFTTSSLTDHRLDVAAITETWTPWRRRDLPACCTTLTHRRSSAHRAGVAVIQHDSVIKAIRSSTRATTPRPSCCDAVPSHRRLHIRNYRSPGPVSIDFGDDLSELFDQLMPSGLRRIVLCGDLDCAGQRAPSLDDRLHDVLQRHTERQLVD